MYLALYRKYRPSKFEEVIGQDAIIKTLQNQIKTDKVGHAYLFCGSRGTGKTSTAKIFAKAINCKNSKDGSPCGECETCRQANNIDILEIDAASNNGVDEIRDLREKVKYPPVNGKYKVYIIDEVHMLSINAFNALLKTLEEPPEFVVFILATTEVHKLPSTILSRCMRFDFKLVALNELINLLKKICDDSLIEYEESALALIARAGEGSVRDTLSVADRCISFCGNKLTASAVTEVLGVASKDSLCLVADNLLKSNVGQMLISVDDVLFQGKSPLVFARDLISYLRDLIYIITVPEKARELVVVNDELFSKMKSQATVENYNKIIGAIEILSEVESELRYSVQPRIVLECNLIKVVNCDNLSLRVSELEKKVQNLTKICENTSKNTVFLPNSEKVQDVKQNSVSINNNLSNIESFKEPSISHKEDLNNNVIINDLTDFLMKEKALSLVAAIKQVKKINVIGSVVGLYFEDDICVDMISSSKYKKLIDLFFEERGLKFQFLSLQQNEREHDLKDLSKVMGNKLKID